MTSKSGQIRVGIGGWTFEPWRGTFYPTGLPHAKELEFASRQLTSIEINGTFYRTQTPATFKKWASEVPQGFVFAVKGPRFAVNRRVLKDAGDAIKHFLNSGVTDLGNCLGPLLWQFAPTKKFEAADFGGFLELLPKAFDGRPLRHVVEVRHDSFATPAFISLAREFALPIVYTDHVKYPNIADGTGDFLYARLQRGQDAIPTAYPPKELDGWATRLRLWSEGYTPDDLRYVETAETPKNAGKNFDKNPNKNVRKNAARDVFCYIIHEGKVRAPDAAAALIERLNKS